MVITAIVKRKREARYDVFLDGQYYATMSDDTILTHRLKVGQAVELHEFASVVAEGDRQDAVNYLLTILSARAYTQKMAIDKLQHHGFSQDAIEFALDKMHYYGYLDDEQFVVDYIEQTRLSRSNRRIRQDLWQRGVDDALVAAHLAHNDESEACYTSLCRKARGHVFEPAFIVKLTRYLTQQGYEYGVVKDCLARYASQEEDD